MNDRTPKNAAISYVLLVFCVLFAACGLAACGEPAPSSAAISVADLANTADSQGRSAEDGGAQFGQDAQSATNFDTSSDSKADADTAATAGADGALNADVDADKNKPTKDFASKPGPHAVATLTEADGLRNGPKYAGATVYYPTDAAGTLASVVIVPGYVSPPSTVAAWGPFYASHGFVAMVIGTNTFTDYPTARAEALLDAIVTLKAENTREKSPLLAKLDTDKFAVSGWSMGGGGAQEAATMDPSLKAVVALCPWQPYRTFQHAVPVLIFGGQWDPTAAVAYNALPHYNKTPETTPKLYFEVAKGGHAIANIPTNAQAEIGVMGLAWLKVYLQGDTSYTHLLLKKPETASAYATNLESL